MHLDDGVLHAYLDGELDDGASGDTEAHLTACAACQERFEAAAAERALATELVADLGSTPEAAPAWTSLVERAGDARGRRVAPRGDVLEASPPRSASRTRGVTPWAWLPTPALAWAATLLLAFSIGWQASRWLPPSPAGESVALLADGEAAVEPQELAVPQDGVVSQAAARQEKAASRQEAPASADEASSPPPAAPLRAQTELDEARREPPPAPERRALAAPAEEPRALLSASSADEEAAAGETDPFRAIADDEAAIWLGRAPLRVPGATLLATSIGPAATLDGADAGRAVLRTVWALPSGARLTLLQQHGAAREGSSRLADAGRRGLADTDRQRPAGADSAAPRARAGEALVALPPTGEARVDWRLADGTLLSISSPDLDAASLAELAREVR